MTKQPPKKCDKGWHTGACCCNCQNHKKLMKHPWNGVVGKGKCTEQMGYVCVLPDKVEENREYIYFESKHGFCELHEWEKYIPDFEKGMEVDMDRITIRKDFLMIFLDEERIKKEIDGGVSHLKKIIEQYEFDGDHEHLQRFLVQYIKEEHFTYLTGIGLLDASDDIVKSAEENGRI